MGTIFSLPWNSNITSLRTMAEFDPENTKKICGLCYENSGKYCCPRCNILFCSLDCYRLEKHSECSESFYRDSVHSELLDLKADPDGSMQKMVDILTKLHKSEAAGEYTGGLHDDTEAAHDDSDDEEVIPLHDRIKGLHLDNADALWDSLTVDERNEFASMINHGEIGHLMPDWDPWWMFTIKERLKRNFKKAQETNPLDQCPPHKLVPEMTALTTVEPSKAIRYNITNVLASYAFTVRYFHGEVGPVEFVIYFLDICDNLNKNTNFDEPALAVESVVLNCLQSELVYTDKKSLDVMRYDTFLIIQGPSKGDPKHFVRSALSHLHKILTRARVKLIKHPNIRTPKGITDKKFSSLFPEHQVKNMVKLDEKKLKMCAKKLKYYLSYLESYSMEDEMEEK